MLILDKDYEWINEVLARQTRDSADSMLMMLLLAS